MRKDPEYRAIVVSAPSGTGKTTLNHRLTEQNRNIKVSISHTTRNRRKNEKDGVHYHFISRQEFQNKIIQEDFLEWAEVHGNFYGTTRGEIDRINRDGCIPLLEIDVQGWLLSRPHLPKATSIFILPPSLEILWKRLDTRGTDSLETRWLRLQNAYREIEIAEHYQYFIINDNLENALDELQAIVKNEKSGQSFDPETGAIFCKKLKEEFQNADWIQRLREKIQQNRSQNES